MEDAEEILVLALQRTGMRFTEYCWKSLFKTGRRGSSLKNFPMSVSLGSFATA